MPSVPEVPGTLRGTTFWVSFQHPPNARHFPQAPRDSRAKGPCYPHRALLPPLGSRDPSYIPLYSYSINSNLTSERGLAAKVELPGAWCHGGGS